MKNVRVWYKKKGRLKYISHLDMNRFMARAIRRSKVPIWYTEGFNPHPYINFALPLSLGFESECEAVDMRITQDGMPLPDIKNALAAQMPDGIEIIDVTEPENKFSAISFAAFEIILSGITADDFSDFIGSDSIICDKKTKKGKIKEIDIKTMIKSADVQTNDQNIVINVILSAGTENNLNPTLLIGAAEKYTSKSVTVLGITRKALFLSDMTKFR